MRLLLDTSVFLKILEDSPTLSVKHRGYIADNRNEKWISQFSFMELMVKMRIGKLPQVSLTPAELLNQAIKDGFLLLPVNNTQIFTYYQLPLFAEHRDPFDRFILSAGIAENMKIVTTDAKFQLYNKHIEIL